MVLVSFWFLFPVVCYGVSPSYTNFAVGVTFYWWARSGIYVNSSCDLRKIKEEK